jgi:hypothetical protein
LPRKCEKLPYSKSEINKIIDSILHPWIEAYPFLLAVDGLLHGLVEGKPEESIRKFIRYNLPTLIEELDKWVKSRSR